MTQAQTRTLKYSRLFSFVFMITGFLAVVSGLASRGNGWLFDLRELHEFQAPMADLFLAGPLAILAGAGLYQGTRWGKYTGLMASGAFMYMSLLFVIQGIHFAPPLEPQYALPALYLMGIAVWYSGWALHTTR